MARLNKLHAARNACVAKVATKKAARKIAKDDLQQIGLDVRSLQRWITQLRTQASQQLKVAGEQLSQGESMLRASLACVFRRLTSDYCLGAYVPRAAQDEPWAKSMGEAAAKEIKLAGLQRQLARRQAALEVGKGKLANLEATRGRLETSLVKLHRKVVGLLDGECRPEADACAGLMLLLVGTEEAEQAGPKPTANHASPASATTSSPSVRLPR